MGHDAASPDVMPGICFGPVSGLSIGQLVPLVRSAERAGFTSIWTGEFGNDCFAWAQAFVHATDRCRIGTSIANIYLRHPAVTAATAAALHELSDGRFIVGLGTGHRSIIEDALGETMQQPLDYLEDYVRATKAILAGEPTHYRGMFFTLDGFRLSTGTPASAPVFVATLGLTAAERAARYADGVLLTLTPPDYERELVQRLRRSAADNDRDPDALKVVQILPCFISEDVDATEVAARRMIIRYAALPFYANMFARAGFDRDVADVQAALADDRHDRAVDAVSDRMVDALAAVGDVTVCRRAIARHHAAGASAVVLYPNAVAADTPDGWHDAIQRLIDQWTPVVERTGGDR